MDKKALYAEILYLGFVSERNRILADNYFFSLKKVLNIEFELWHSVISLMNYKELKEKDKIFFKYFVEICKKNQRIYDNHKIGCEQIQRMQKSDYSELTLSYDNDKEDKIIINIMNDLVNQLLDVLNENYLIINKRKIYNILRAVHNLPRYFLKKITQQSPEIEAFEYSGIDFKDAIDYSFLNMDDSMKMKYLKYFQRERT